MSTTANDLQRILVAYDGFAREDALPLEALELARRFAAKVRIIHVVDGAGWQALPSVGIADHLDLAAMVGHRRAALDALVVAANGTDVVESVVIRDGLAHIEIIREAMAWDADMVCVADHPLRRGEEYGFGAVTMKLLRKCPQPVLALRHDHLLADSRIVAAVDLRAGQEALNRAVVGWAVDLAGVTADVTVFHAWEVWGEDLLRAHAPGHAESRYSEVEAVAQRNMATLAAGFGSRIDRLKTVIAHGAARVEIAKFVEREHIDLVVMGTVSRTGLKGLVIGNTAERTLNRLKASVLAVKPDGFVSSVTPRD